jgi:hypothetical protein
MKEKKQLTKRKKEKNSGTYFVNGTLFVPALPSLLGGGN